MCLCILLFHVVAVRVCCNMQPHHHISQQQQVQQQAGVLWSQKDAPPVVEHEEEDVVDEGVYEDVCEGVYEGVYDTQGDDYAGNDVLDVIATSSEVCGRACGTRVVCVAVSALFCCLCFCIFVFAVGFSCFCYHGCFCCGLWASCIHHHQYACIPSNTHTHHPPIPTPAGIPTASPPRTSRHTLPHHRSHV